MKEHSISPSQSEQGSKSIYKTPKRRRYVSISNELAQHPDLSLEAIGLMTYVLSLPEDWQINFIHLQKRAKCGRQKLQHLLRELQLRGYLIRHVKRVSGRYATEWQFHEVPVDPSLTGDEIPQRLNRNGQTAAVNHAAYKPNSDKQSQSPLVIEIEKKVVAVAADHHHLTNDNNGGGGAHAAAAAIASTGVALEGGSGSKRTPAQRNVVQEIARRIREACNRGGRNFVLADDVMLLRTAGAVAARASYDLQVWEQLPGLQDHVELARDMGMEGLKMLGQLRGWWGLS